MSEVLITEGPDAGAAWHYGNPVAEQRLLESGQGAVVLGQRDVLSVSGPDRLTWLNQITSQKLDDLAPGVGTTALILSPQGHINHVLYGVDDSEVFWVHTEPGAGPALLEFLQRMIFRARVEVVDRTAELAIVWRPGPGPQGRVTRTAPDSLGGHESFVPRGHLDSFLEGVELAGMWAYEARRIAAGVPRIGLDTDHRTIPNELGLPGVHLEKGCYPGQETVGRVHTLGRPPRRLVLLHLDGSVDALPDVGAALTLAGREVGFVGSSARHHELGPIALGVVKRNVPIDAEFAIGEIAAAQEVLVDPEVGLHVKARL